jgi:hypothetical protein
MSIEIYGSRFHQGQLLGIPVALLSQAFDGLIAKTGPNAFMLALEPHEGILIPLYFEARDEQTNSFSIARPVDDPSLYEALLRLLHHEGIVVYAPGSPPVLGHPESVGHLPEGMTDALGAGVIVYSASALKDALFNE